MCQLPGDKQTTNIYYQMYQLLYFFEILDVWGKHMMGGKTTKATCTQQC